LDRTARTRQPGQGSQDRKARTGELGQESQKGRHDSTARIIDLTAWTGECGQNREDKSGHDSNARTAASRELWTRLLGQDSWHSSAGIGQPGRDSEDRTAREDSQDRISRTGNIGQYCQNRTARAGELGEDKGQDNHDISVGKGPLGQSHSDRTARTGQSGQVSLTFQPGWVSLDKTERIELPGYDSDIKRAVDKGAWAEQLEENIWDRVAGTGQPGWDAPERDSWAGQLE
jgi:hypothetical protein